MREQNKVECPITLLEPTQEESLLLRIGDPATKTPTYYYIYNDETLKKLKECPITRNPIYAYIKLSNLNPTYFIHLQTNSSPSVLKEQKALLATPELAKFSWQIREFSTHQKPRTWSRLNPAPLANSCRIRQIKTLFETMMYTGSLLVILLIPVMNVVLLTSGGYILGSMLFRMTINAFCNTHEHIRRKSLNKLISQVPSSHDEIKENCNSLSAQDINSAISEYNKPLIKRFSFLFSLVSLGLLSKHQSDGSFMLLKSLQLSTDTSNKKRIIQNYISNEKNYGKRLFCCLTKQISRNIEEKQNSHPIAAQAIPALGLH